MFRKIFINVFFEKKRILISIMTIITALLSYVGIQVAYYSNKASILSSPDFVVYGQGDIYGSKGYELFNETYGLRNDTKEVLGNDIKVYDMVVRNIVTKSCSGFFQKIDYWIYGLDDSFFNDIIKKELKEGRLPDKNKNEAVIGSYAANYFKLKVGDKIKIPITLNKDMNEKDNEKYIVTGIINENADFFKSGIFISKNTFEKENGMVKENAVIGYFKEASSINKYKVSYSKLNELFKKYNIGTISENFHNKMDIKRNIIFNIFSVFLVITVILSLIILYLMKGIKKKIGLLKALGVSDKYILKVFIGGLAIVLIVSTILSTIITLLATIYINKSISSFLGFNIHLISVNSIVLEVEAAIMAIQIVIIYILIKIISSRISPIDSMTKL